MELASSKRTGGVDAVQEQQRAQTVSLLPGMPYLLLRDSASLRLCAQMYAGTLKGDEESADLQLSLSLSLSLSLLALLLQHPPRQLSSSASQYPAAGN
ncbi:hypothetical protein KUCAC02_012128 [Chaenocephalus aceratus]|uniref:Uncharacterized protein n=1 Tax=Chaenocephalus aceratus TaxID=36190 RepID=A0ACB9X9R6_CHAAC|nr:hypothetical protein KUCAC02_012128 [Chaenocephalus aceratus]